MKELGDILPESPLPEPLKPLIIYQWSERLSEIDGNKMLTFFAHAPGELAPVAWLALDLSEPAGYIARLFVDKAHRRASLGQALVSQAVVACQEHGFKSIGLSVHNNNAAARRLYERLGFVQYINGHEGYTQFVRLLK